MDGKYYVSENVAPEVYALRKETKDLADASVADAETYHALMQIIYC